MLLADRIVVFLWSTVGRDNLELKSPIISGKRRASGPATTLRKRVEHGITQSASTRCRIPP
jgi:hypothetical protein